MEWLANIWHIIWHIFLPIAVVGGVIYYALITIQSSIVGMQFQQTHPITQARVLRTFTHTYYTDDSQTHTSSRHTETCAARISFRANGQDIEVDVSQMLACPMQIGDQPKIAYDPQQPAHVQFVPGGDPFWGNILQILLVLPLVGVALFLGIAFIRDSRRGWL
ncbi:hypothetical protein Krac_3783 [Ktedonobacter racemifer DSM 44963]|uniref:DUF3592 domain-containing protein n=1 Tax=Ktedonobacter racemifer DSM 44963 TaxID=485913 RepID=D6U2Z6_KTERA|nr:hypothetical protein Krac_3783 [Ktedonobacter racemifer DSM 44963]